MPIAFGRCMWTSSILTLTIGLVLSTGAVASAEEVDVAMRIVGTRKVQQKLDKLAENPALAEKQLGVGTRIIALGTKPLKKDKWFDYDGKLTKLRTQSTLQVRENEPDRRFLNIKLSTKDLVSAGTKPRLETDMKIKALNTGRGTNVYNPFGNLPQSWTKSVKLTEGETGGQRTRYVVQQDGKNVGEIDLANHYFKMGSKTQGVGGFDFAGQHGHATKLMDHLGLRPKSGPSKYQTAMKILSRGR